MGTASAGNEDRWGAKILWDFKKETGQPVFLTKNGYGSMVVLSMEAYSRLTDSVEAALSEADATAASDPTRLSHEEVFSRLRGRVNAR